MINLQIDLQIFRKFKPEKLLSLFIIFRLPEIRSLPTEMQPHEVWKLRIRNVLKEHQDQIICLSVSHMIHGDAELGHEDVVLDWCSGEEQDRLEASLNDFINSIKVVHPES